VIGRRNPIRRHGDTPLAHFTIIPNELARDTDLSMHAYRAAIVIRTHADGYELSSVSLAESQGWGRARTRAALRELIEAGWLVIRPHKTADGTRAFEEYHVHAARKFTPEESATLAEPVILGDPGLAQANPLVPFGPTPWSHSGHPPGLAQAIKEDYLEDQLEDQEEDQATDEWSEALTRLETRTDQAPQEHSTEEEYCQDCEDNPCNVCGFHFHTRNHRYREPAKPVLRPIRANTIAAADNRCHAPECEQAPIPNGRWCFKHVHLAVTVSS
jgi:hypothetical protein